MYNPTVYLQTNYIVFYVSNLILQVRLFSFYIDYFPLTEYTKSYLLLTSSVSKCLD